MRLGMSNAPASVRRAFFFGATLALTAFAGQQPSSAPDLAQVGLPDAAEAARLLEQFRTAGIPGEYYLEFQLQTMPRRGDTRVHHGRLWGGRNDRGSITRVEVTDAGKRSHRFLIQNGERPGVWRLQEGRVVQLESAALFEPLMPGVEVTPFDLQMPYLYWPDARVQAIRRVLGRPAHAFFFRAPSDIQRLGQIGGVRAYLDTQFNALTQTELLGSDNRVKKTFSLLSIKTVERQTLPKMVDFRNEVTRDKTRMVVTAAALQLDFGPAPFAPEALVEDLRPPGRGLQRLD
jgi:hypothetical protein